LNAYSVLVKEFGAAHTRAMTVGDYIVELYDATKRPDQAAEWRAKAGPSP
jgi:hypothetical protein